MIRRHANHRVLQRPGLGQPVVEVLQRQLHLQIGGDEGLHGGGGVGVGGLGLRLVAGGHGLGPAPVGVSADGHIVGVEGGSVVGVIGEVFVHRGLHHLQIGVGPGAVAVGLQLQAVAAAHVEIPQVGMGLVPLIVGVFIVVPRPAVVAQCAQLVAHSQGHIVPGAGVKADVAVYPGGNEARHGGELAAGSGLAPGGLIVVGEYKALMGHLVQHGRQFRGDDVRGKGLRRNENEVLPGEHAGVFILIRGGLGGEIPVHGRQCLVALVLRQGGKVDVQGVFAVFLRRRQGRPLVHDLGDVHGGLLRHAGDGVQRFQPQLCHQPEFGDGAVGGEIVGVHVAVGPEMAHHHAAHLQHNGGPQRRPLYSGAV